MDVNDDDAALIALRETQRRLDRLENNLRSDIREGCTHIISTIENFRTQLENTDRAQVIAD